MTDRHNTYGQLLVDELKNADIRAKLDDREEKLGAKIRHAQMDKIPLMVIIGDKEVSENGGTLRLRSQEDKGFMSKVTLFSTIKDLCQRP